MFKWKGTLNRAAYALRSIIAIAFLIGTILFFPFVTKAIVTASHCALDTCGAVGLIVPTVTRPLLFIAAIAMVLSACVRRARDAGLHPWLGAFPPLMLAGDQGFLQYAGAGWAYPFSTGIMSLHPPVYALFATSVIALLGFPSRDSLRDGDNRLLDKALLVLATILSMAALLRTGVLPLAALIKFPFLMLPTIWFEQYARFVMPLFLVMATYRIWRSHGAAPMTAASTAVPSPAAPSLWRPRRAALVGAVIALAVLLWSLQTSVQMSFLMVLISLAAWLLPAFVPTFLLYTALVTTVMRLIARRDAIAAAALVAALIPFGLWAMSLSTVLRAKAEERAVVAAIPKVALPANISGVVIEGEDWSLMNCARGRVLSDAFDFGDVLTHGQSKSPYLRFTRATANSPVGTGRPADNAPSEYILIRFPRRPTFFQDRVALDITSPPVEIYAVDPDGTRLVAATYTALNRPPAFPPMLTAYGWYSGDNSTTSEIMCRSVGQFLQRELLDKLPSVRS
ncbi:hypothetical protein UP10_25915 [Bradyrhizobium sp. LTSPM299]|uniref:hypothetical protein n=1 Tax=Bradyrhizobium sp. LTSPM299 TaxID=1619233 RepID=UPI0005C941D7|nr:hypothetical protein [Bradyrhizobium sp. LTSPM299]KJC58381.1 hypothetical protein UP10_25915 [Bradyrhizobium sp. LTSPM299]